MSKQELNELMQSQYSSYVNWKRKREQEPMPYHVFRMRFRMWKEW